MSANLLCSITGRVVLISACATSLKYADMEQEVLAFLLSSSNFSKMTVYVLQGNVRYVIAGNPTGWAAMAKTIRDVDQDKVMDCKEDIDTLLVFTGLFSAVLTAFVVESYTALSPDKMDTVILLLGQITNQTSSYTVTSNVINSTAPPLTPDQLQAPFEPPLAQLRVNQLWFASLVLTLITASFAMLVKQWLREYLAFDYTSPHERLRARQFRHPGLIEWKVFEIAGFLPILLQISLGLFFLGLCYFTWAANSGVGTTSTVLISAWAFLFVSATIAPLSSPRCPYKTALLKNVMLASRRRIKRHFFPGSMRRDSDIPLDDIDNDSLLRSWPQKRYFVEEADAISQGMDELEILKEVDAFLLDDDLLATTIFDSLMQYYADPPTIIKFVLQALNVRLKEMEFYQPLGKIPDLRRLSKRSYIAISDIVANVVLNSFGKQVSNVGPWFEDALKLLLSQSIQPLTPNARNALVRCVQRTTISRFGTVLDSLGLSSGVVAQRLHDVLEELSVRLRDLLFKLEVPPMDVITLVVKCLSLETNNAPCAVPLQSILDLRSVSQLTWNFGSDTVGAAIVHALTVARREDIGPWLDSAINLLLSASQYPLTDTGVDALSGLCKQTVSYNRLGSCIRAAARPDGAHYPHVLSRLRDICKSITSAHSMKWILSDVLCAVPCTPQCTHPRSGAPLGLLLHDHIPHQLEWAQHFLPLLLDRLDGTPSAPCSLESLYALLACPVPLQLLNPDLPKVISGILSARNISDTVLHPLVSIQDEPSMNIDVVTENIISLLADTNSEGRREFFYGRYLQCRDYYNPFASEASDHQATSKLNAADLMLRDVCRDFYSECAKAMERFRHSEFDFIGHSEQSASGHLAKECLFLLDSLELSANGHDAEEWMKTFKVEDSVFPDSLFENLALFIPENVAIRSKRVRRLRQIGVDRENVGLSIPGVDDGTSHVTIPSEEDEDSWDASSEDMELGNVDQEERPVDNEGLEDVLHGNERIDIGDQASGSVEGPGDPNHPVDGRMQRTPSQKKTRPGITLVAEATRNVAFGCSVVPVPLTNKPKKRDRLEYSFIGDAINLALDDGQKMPAVDYVLRLKNGLLLTYGQINALAGDFYGTKDPISDGSDLQEQSRRFLDAYKTLAERRSRQPNEARDILSVLRADIDAVNAGLANHTDPAVVFAKLPDTTLALLDITVGRSDIPDYVDLARTNWDHFGVDARKAYNVGHTIALQTAVQGDLEGAYALNAFADHFLENCFLAGHLRTPRRKLHDGSNPTMDFCAKFMHDEDNAIGLSVENPRGDKWTVYGGKRALDVEDADNLARCIAAVQASADENLHRHGREAPTLESATGNQLLAPLFNASGERRKDIKDRRTWAFKADWGVWSTARKCLASGLWRHPIKIEGVSNIMPGSAIAVTMPGLWRAHVFYQNPKGGVLESKHYGVWSGGIDDPAAFRAPPFTPLAVVDCKDGNEIRVYFINEQSLLREACYSAAKESWVDGPLNELNIQAAGNSSIAAFQFDIPQLTAPESNSLTIQEFCTDDTVQWQRGAILPTALSGSSLAAVSYTYQGLQVRIYYQAEDLSIREHCWNGAHGWHQGKLNGGKAPGHTPITAIGYPGRGAAVQKVYWINTQNEIVQAEYKGNWTPTTTVMGPVRSGSGLAAAHWNNGQRIRLYYQSTDDSVLEICNDGDKWFSGSMHTGECHSSAAETPARLHYTLHLPSGDPLNGGNDFYDPIVAELLTSAGLTLFWVPWVIHIIHRSYDYGFGSTFAAEIIGLFILFVMWLVGAAIATTFWGNLHWCHEFLACRLLTTLVAFAWMGWIIIFLLLAISVMFAAANGAFGHPMHGRYDPRASAYAPNPRRRFW
ncbi:hypothetical protein NM688_g402 [Phlebia brevispora]|uniref:Uncharacterized protein n=1 Tax=Phlebia brevispora TaxID=194682 RepID=A0ACC1TER3_9APHY|nr:hypothetical protein NM688_g402 [Phlebia brevispora]